MLAGNLSLRDDDGVIGTSANVCVFVKIDDPTAQRAGNSYKSGYHKRLLINDPRFVRGSIKYNE
jgi:hypothetical protein